MKIQYLVNALLLLNQAPSLFASQCLPDLETFFRTKTSVKFESVVILQSNEHACLDHPFCQVGNTFWISHFKANEQTLRNENYNFRQLLQMVFAIMIYTKGETCKIPYAWTL